MSTVDTTIGKHGSTIAGLKEALRELNNLDKVARRQLTKDFQAVCKPVVDAAKRATPQAPPISGWGRSWTTRSGYKALPWQANLATKNIKAKVSGKKPREYNGRMTNLAVFTIAWGGTINTIYDLASNSQTAAGANMVRGLEARHGKASRALWPAYRANQDEVERQVTQIIDDVMRTVSKAI